MLLDAIIRGVLLVTFDSFVVFMNGDSQATFYTSCFNTDSVTYVDDPIFTSECTSLSRAASQCTVDTNCDSFSRNGTQCSFFTKENNSVACEREIAEKFMSAEYKILFQVSDIWTKVGPLYLYVTPGQYSCDTAQDVCISLGGTMAEFYSIEEMDNAYTFITDSAIVGSYHFNGKYLWKTTDQEVDSNLWASGQPYDNGPCVQIWTQNRGLDDIYFVTKKNVLCEKRIP